MCGIAGIVYEDPDRPVEARTLERMAERLRHRGPDDRGSWSGDGAGLAHTRLAVIDLSPDGRQPMSNENGSVFVAFNGEIYNFVELRDELAARGHIFRSRSDTEVIVHLYEDEGIDCVDRLDGMFAFAVWDRRRRRLLLARDRLGKKPLKYAELPGGLVFASELKAILASGLVEPRVDPGDISHYLGLGFVPGPATGFTGIRKLPPAHRLVLEEGDFRIDRYWTLDFRRKSSRAVPEWREAVRSSVERAVSKRLVSDVPLGAFLSGGIDSSVVVSCMSKTMSRPVETFSAGFEFDAYDELPYARAVAERYRTSHHEFRVRADTASLLPLLARLFEEPFADCSALPSYLLAQEARQHVTVALNGDGGDEGFAGYTRYARLADWDSRLNAASRLGLPRLAGVAAAVLAKINSGLASPFEAIRHLADPELAVRYGWMMRLFSERERSTLCRNGGTMPVVSAGERFLDLLSDSRAGNSPIDRMTFGDAMLYLPDVLLVKIDLASMAHGLEARSPLLDPEVMSLAASAPAQLKYHNGSLKALLKEAFRDELPEEILDRRKMGFVVPLEEWFRGPLLPLARELLLSPDARIRDYFRERPLGALVERHAAGAASHGRQLWGLVMLELWHREVVEQPRPSAIA
jgi:asparagine synthase (glutamine-hydrolysing)